MTDDAGRLTFVSDQSSTILGWEPEELIGRSFSELAPPEERRGALARFRALRHAPARGAPDAAQDRRAATAASSRWRSPASAWSRTASSSAPTAPARDVSERDRLERDLRRQAVELASSEERSHLARELHDSVTQALFSMTLLSRSIELLLVKDPSQVPGKLASLRELQREALAEMRALIFELRPGNVEENGLIQALRTHSAALSGRIGLPVVVEGDLADRPPIDVEEGALPDRAGGAPQRRQARGREAGAGRGRARARRRAPAGDRRRPRLRPERPCPTATSAWPGCRRAPSASAGR